MIISVTPNPALDVTGVVKEIIPNEKTYVFNEQRFPGGNAINASRIMNLFDVPVLTTGFLGGAVGSDLIDLLDKEGVNHHFIDIKGSTRFNVTVSNQKTLKQTRLSFPGPQISTGDTERLCDLVSAQKGASLLNVGGSFPPGFEVADLKKLLQAADALNIGSVVDVPSQHLAAAVELRPMMIKPNLSEFREFVGRKVTTVKEVIEAARPLTEYIPLVCVSSVEKGAVLVTPTQVWKVDGPAVEAKSSVGAGDAMVGAMMTQLYKAQICNNDAARAARDPDIETVLRWGLSSALATIVKPGTELGSAESIRAFLPKVSAKVVRKNT